MAMNIASGALPIVPLAVISNGAAVASFTSTVDWTRYYVIIVSWIADAGANNAFEITMGGNQLCALTPTTVSAGGICMITKNGATNTVSNSIACKNNTGTAIIQNNTYAQNNTVAGSIATGTFTYTVYGVAVR